MFITLSIQLLFITALLHVMACLVLEQELLFSCLFGDKRRKPQKLCNCINLTAHRDSQTWLSNQSSFALHSSSSNVTSNQQQQQPHYIIHLQTIQYTNPNFIFLDKSQVLIYKFWVFIRCWFRIVRRRLLPSRRNLRSENYLLIDRSDDLVNPKT